MHAHERLDAVMGPGGIADCGKAQNCVRACPKDIPLTESLVKLARETTLHGIKELFRK
jgi:succinate dehydrogenase / fumarate reductase iron-sulfur subunit